MTYTATDTRNSAWPLLFWRLFSRSLALLLFPLLLAPQDGPTTGTDIFEKVIANQKRMESNLDVYERIQKLEIRKTGSDQTPSETKVWRIFPSGPKTCAGHRRCSNCRLIGPDHRSCPIVAPSSSSASTRPTTISPAMKARIRASASARRRASSPPPCP